MPPPNSQDIKDLTRAVLALNEGMRKLATVIEKSHKASTKVPLVHYLRGEREVIGEAEVHEDGRVDMTVDHAKFDGVFDKNPRSMSIQEKED